MLLGLILVDIFSVPVETCTCSTLLYFSISLFDFRLDLALFKGVLGILLVRALLPLTHIQPQIGFSLGHLGEC